MFLAATVRGGGNEGGFSWFQPNSTHWTFKFQLSVSSNICYEVIVYSFLVKGDENNFKVKRLIE